MSGHHTVFHATLALAAAALITAPLSAQLTSEQVVDLKLVTSVAMHPSGEYVAYGLRVPRGADEERGGSYTEIWVVPTRGGEPRRYTSKPVSAFDVGWSVDGAMITFRARREAHDPHTQVWGIMLGGGEAERISQAQRNVGDYAFSPDGTKLAYTMRDAVPDEVLEARRRGYDQRVIDTWDGITRLYVQDLTTGGHNLVTEDELHVWNFAWAPDGNTLIFRGSERPFTDDGYMFTDYYMVPSAGGSATLLHDTDGKLAGGTVSPAGSYVAWLGAVSLNDPASGSLFVGPTGGGTPVNLTDGYEGTAVSFAWKDERTILLNTLERTRTYLYEVSVSGGMRALRGSEGPIFRGLSLSEDGTSFATVCSTPTHPNEVCVGSSNGSSMERLTVSNPELADMEFGEQESISWTGPDGWEITGVLIKPVGFREGTAYPLQMQVHGGPESAYLDGWNTSYSTLAQMLAQRGIMVFMPNYRGSTGRGVEYAKGDHDDPMGKEFEDMLAGIDYLVELGYADPDRVGVGGGSYGGYTAAWATTKHSDRFQAAVVFAGIANQTSKIGMTDTPAENALVHWNFWHYENWDLVWDRSPIAHIQNANTPTLIGHGERDLRVPTGQAFELFRALQWAGVKTQLVIYPREPHGLRERAHQVDWNQRILAWYERHLLGAPTP